MVRRRSPRSYVVEIAFVAIIVVGLYLFMTNGGPQWFGEWFAAYLAE
jgi:hypothetical protein